VASNQRQGRRPAGLQRLALLVFAAALVLLFVGFAIAEGIGDPSISSGDVVVVEDVPGDTGAISEADFESALARGATSAGLKSAPKPGDKQYEEVKESALGELLNAIWIEGQAAEMGISATPEEVSNELEKLKKQGFKTEAEFKEFLKTSNLTPADVNKIVEQRILSQEIQKQLGENAPVPSSDEIEDFYEAAKSTQFTQPETREIRLIANKDKEKVEEAKAELEKDNSASSWEKVAKQFSTGPSKNKGGLTPGVSEGRFGEPLDAAIASAPTGQIEGPVEGSLGYSLFEVESVTLEKIQSLKEVKAQISGQLTEQAQQAAFARFIADFSERWRSRTFCAPDFTTKQCANFESDGRPAEANPACYEADPKGDLRPACPAPVQQVTPALPGTITILAPEGEKLPQRPLPSTLPPAAEPAGLPSGAPLPESPGN